jgi:hypothetical protein
MIILPAKVHVVPANPKINTYDDDNTRSPLKEGVCALVVHPRFRCFP